VDTSLLGGGRSSEFKMSFITTRTTTRAMKEKQENTDITFLIGNEPFTERIEARSDILSQRSPVFRAMLEGPLAENRNATINVKDVDPRAFEILISFMKGGTVKFKSVLTALAVIYAAQKYMVKKIDNIALKFINKNLTRDNVLMVLQHLYVLLDKDNPQNSPEEVLPSAPPLEEFLDSNLDSFESNSYGSYSVNSLNLVSEACYEKPCELVMKRCFNIIDKNAKLVLESDDFEDVSLELLKHIIKRDSLEIDSELLVLEAVNRWSHRQCRRCHLTINPDNKRHVLQGAQYFIRYLTLTSEQLKMGQIETNILTKEEELHILFSILHLGASMPEHLQPFKQNMKTKRQVRKCWRKRLWYRREKCVEHEDPMPIVPINVKEKISFIEILFVFIGKILD